MKIEFSQIVDLSHEISRDMLVWHGDPATRLKVIHQDLYTVEMLSIGTHTGTHIGAPEHFGFQKSVLEFPLNMFLTRAALFDVSESKCNLTAQSLEKWQNVHGELTEKCVILRTAQDVFWKDGRYFRNYPGFSVEAIEYLLKVGVRIFGTDAPGVDPSDDNNFSSNTKLFENGGFHLENLTNLDGLPERFWILVAPLKMKSGGAPVRVVALV